MPGLWYCESMKYEEFRAAWERALAESGMPAMGLRSESVDLLDMDRTYTVRVAPLGGQDAAPFFVVAELSWRWDALHAARASTTEEDVLTELHGRERAADLDTEPPWLRVDVALHASLPWGEPAAMPTQSNLARWSQEMSGRLESVERLLPDTTVRETEDGMTEMLAWQGTPELVFSCDEEGALALEKVTLRAWQAVTLPRSWSDTSKFDADPEPQLSSLFAHVKTALLGWMECLDHLA